MHKEIKNDSRYDEADSKESNLFMNELKVDFHAFQWGKFEIKIK